METIKKGKFIFLFLYLKCIVYLAKYYINSTMYFVRRLKRSLLFYFSVLNIVAHEIAFTTTTSMEVIVRVKCYANIHISI